MIQDIEIYRFFNYRDYLSACFPSKGAGRGERKRLADFLGCQPGFISLVFSGKSDFSLEHGIQLCEFLHLNDEEKNYLILLLQKDRAGSVILRRHFEIQIKAIQKDRKEIKSRITTTRSLTTEEQLQYYEGWIFTAIHMCTLVPRLRTPAAMKDYLNLPTTQIKDALETLLKLGLVNQQSGQYFSTQKRIHLGEKGLTLKKHHSNWRLQSINSLDRKQSDELHYTSIMSISKSAAEEIKQIILKSIQDCEPVIKAAKDECVVALAVDLFEVGED
ncbi:MAG TPA: TIGR02147 family protein, partial [Bdellovibrio sp.]|nr:TIGR02147 family protein [Bdellovibrio sp.]